MTTSYNWVPDGKGGYNPIPATPEPQSLAVKAGKAQAFLTNASAEVLAKEAATAPAVTVTTIDGVPTVVARPALSDSKNVGQLVPAEDLEAIGIEPDAFPVCEYPGCKGEGRNQIISSAGKPLSINRKGELVFGDPPPMPHAGMSARDKARAKLGLDGVIGPSGLMGQQMPKCHVDVCWEHQTLPHAPKKPARRFRSGPYPSYFSASRRAYGIDLRTRTKPKVYALNTPEGEAWYVEGDDGEPGWNGSLEVMSR